MTTYALPAGTFRDLLTTAALFAQPTRVHRSKVDTPILKCVEVDVTPGRVTVSATDRYMLGVGTYAHADVEGEGTFLVPSEVVKRIAALVGKRPHPRLMLDVTAGIGDVTVSHGLGEGAVTFPVVLGDYPRLDRVARFDDDPTPISDAFPFNMALLAALAKAVPVDRAGNRPVEFSHWDRCLRATWSAEGVEWQWVGMRSHGDGSVT